MSVCLFVCLFVCFYEPLNLTLTKSKFGNKSGDIYSNCKFLQFGMADAIIQILKWSMFNTMNTWKCVPEYSTEISYWYIYFQTKWNEWNYYLNYNVPSYILWNVKIWIDVQNNIFQHYCDHFVTVEKLSMMIHNFGFTSSIFCVREWFAALKLKISEK